MDSAATDARPVFLMLGLHHAREWPSGEKAMEFAYDLVSNYGHDARITDLLKKARVIVVPVVNADGFDLSRDRRRAPRPAGGRRAAAPWPILGTPGNAYKRKNCRIVDGVETPPRHVPVTAADQPRRLRHRRRPQPQLRRLLGRAGRVAT